MKLDKHELMKIIPEELHFIFTLVGVEKALEIVKNYEGSSVYFGKSLQRKIDKAFIVAEYQEGNVNYKELSKKYGYSSSWIRQICIDSQNKILIPDEPVSQKSLF